MKEYSNFNGAMEAEAITKNWVNLKSLMNRGNLLIKLLTVCLLLTSCEKEPENLTVLLNQSGTLSIKVTDDNKNGFKGAKVSIYSSVPSGERIYYGSTDANGICAIGKVLQGQYSYYIHAENNNKIYGANDYFQVIAGEDKIVKINPFLNIGDAKVKIVNAHSESIGNVNVALIPHPRYSGVDYYFQELIEEAYAIGKTDSEGWVEFQNMPAGTVDYSVLAYFDGTTYDYPISNNYMYIRKDFKQNFTIKVNL